MKFGYIKLCYIIMTVMYLAGQTSCKKKDSQGDSDLYVYASPGSAAYNITGTDTVSILEAGITKSERISFPVFISRAFNKDVQVTARIDPSLVTVYDNITNGIATPSPVLDPAAVALANGGKIVIKSGSTASADSIRVLIKDPSLLATGARTHVIPVVLEAATENIPVSVSRKIMFVKVYGKIMSAGISSLGNTNMIRDSVAKNGNTVGGNNLFYLKGLLVDKVSGNQTIQVEANNALLKEYNSANKTNYQEFPANMYQLLQPSALVPAGAVSSKDSIVIKLDNLNNLEAAKEYLLPLQVKSVSGTPQLPVISNQKIAYLYLKVLSSNVDPRNSGLTGTTINRTGWTATASAQYTTNAPARALDGSTTTYWITTIASLPAYMDLNMGSVKTVKGFNITPPTTTSYSFLTMEVYSSQDGNTWSLEGTFNTPTSSNAVKTIRFVNPVTAQYFRFNIIRGGGTAYSGIAELNGVE